MAASRKREIAVESHSDVTPARGAEQGYLKSLPATGAYVSSKPDSVTPGTVLYWLGLAVLLILMVAIIWNVYTSPASLGI
jgi:hypothetical protein